MNTHHYAEKIYYYTEMRAERYVKKLIFFLILLFFSLILQLIGDSTNQHLIIESIVRTSITNPVFVGIFLSTCLAHVFTYKLLQKKNT